MNNKVNEVNNDELYKEERECILRFIMAGKPLLAPTDEIMFAWCMERNFIDYDADEDKYFVTEKGFNHVSMC
jgi:hypothetical protein